MLQHGIVTFGWIPPQKGHMISKQPFSRKDLAKLGYRKDLNVAVQTFRLTAVADQMSIPMTESDEAPGSKR
jgi:hypothetical protein